jgi:hypothetical protein
MVEDLPVGYYLDNFRYLLDFVSRRYRDVLEAREIAWSTGFHALSLDAQRLYVRLLCRKGPLFRDDKLTYDEISDRAAAIDELMARGYAGQGEDATLEEMLALFRRDELHCLSSEIGRGEKRATIVEHLLETADPDHVRGSLPFRMVEPLGVDAYRVHRLLFFGNLRQDLTEFVLRDLGISPYEEYEIHGDDRFFDERCVLEDALSIYEISDESALAVDQNDVEKMVFLAERIPMVSHAKLKRRAGRILGRMARQLERLEEEDLALDLYRRTEVAPSRERQARILEKQKEVERAVSICRTIFVDPEDEAEFEFAVGFGRRIAKRHSVQLDEWPDPDENDWSQRHIEVHHDPDLRVEELARRWFEENVEGASAWYVENGLFPSLFGLAFWDIIFHPVKGVFFNPFQRGPDDLFTSDFRDSRQALINERLTELEDANVLEARLWDTYRCKYPTANYFVHWGVLTEELLTISLARIPVTHLLSVFRRLLRDLRHNRAGFPDLVVFPAEASYLLAEVKGPGDTLQNNQKRWLRYFQRAGVPSEVVSVSWQ